MSKQYSLMDTPDPPNVKQEVLRARTCTVCPLKACKKADRAHKAVDILIISEPTPEILYSEITGYSTLQVPLIECQPMTLTEKERLSPKYRDAEVACTQRKLDLIASLKPKIVIAAGFDVYKALDNALGFDTGGECFFQPLATEYKGHQFWILPIPGDQLLVSYKQLMATGEVPRCISKPPKIGKISTKPIRYLMSTEEAVNLLNSLNGPAYSWDYETNGLRPYSSGAKILSFSVSDGETSWGFPMWHRETPSHYDPVQVAIAFIALSKRTKLICHNGMFEGEWSIMFLGPEFMSEGKVEDTQAQAYLIRKDAPQSLDFLCRSYFGIALKTTSGVDVKSLETEPLNKVLEYNCKDTYWDFKLWEAQNEILKRDGLHARYLAQAAAVPVLAHMQFTGLPVDQNELITQFNDKIPKLSSIEHYLQTLPSVVQFNQDRGTVFNAMSPDDVADLHHNYLGVSKQYKSFDEENLSLFDFTESATILNIRDFHKQLYTYLAPLCTSLVNVKDAGKLVYPDGRVHNTWKPYRTITGRLSSSNPNVQNYPKKHKSIRNWFKAPDGYSIVSIDYGQIEYRVIAWLSRDKNMIQALWDDRDIHKHWALKLNAALNGRFIKDVNDPKQVAAFRQDVKSSWTFKLCFGGGAKSVARQLKVADSQPIIDGLVNEFWKEHPGVKQWHNDLGHQLATKYCVHNVYGRRFWAPLSYNKMINYPIQGSAGDLMVAAMVRLYILAFELGIMELIPIISIHDDLTFLIQTDRVQELLPIILTAMLDTSECPGLPVPLIAEVSMGQKWGKQDAVGVFSSEDICPAKR